MRCYVLSAIVIVGAAFAACGGETGDSTFDPNNRGDSDAGLGGDGDITGDSSFFEENEVTELAFDPPSASLTVDGVTEKSASFTLKAKNKSGSERTVVAESVQFDRPDLAKMTAGPPVTLTAPGQFAGSGTLQGVFKGKVAKAKLDVKVHFKENIGGVAPAIVAALDAAGLAQDPSLSTLLYPYDKTVFPLGLSSPLIRWNAPASGDVYRLRYEQASYVYDTYVTVTAPGRLRVPQIAWDRLTASNTGDPLKVTLNRWDGSKAYASAKEEWTIAPSSLRGAIYYWTTSQGGHLSRIRPGTGAQPEVLNNGKCMGCHAVSADGTTLVASVEGQVTSDGSNDNRAWVYFGLPDGTLKRNSTYFAGNLAVNPNGKYTVFGDRVLKIAETATGVRNTTSGLETMHAAGTSGLMTPAFSPDGKKLTAVEGNGSWYHNLTGGRLVVMDFDEATVKFSNKVNLAAATLFPSGQRAIAYPTFTPDSKWIAFHVGDYATGCDVQGCDDNAKQIGNIWLQNTSGAAPVKLTALSDPSAAADKNVSYEPTFNPVERGGYFWVVFTSSRDWGNKITGVANNGKKRLWVAAIAKNPGAGDPSHPAFFLEGQEENTTNMRGFWALAACKATGGQDTCSAGFECRSGFCDRGVCIDSGAVACKAAGEACSTDTECCNHPAVRCVAGRCQTTPR